MKLTKMDYKILRFISFNQYTGLVKKEHLTNKFGYRVLSNVTGLCYMGVIIMELYDPPDAQCMPCNYFCITEAGINILREKTREKTVYIVLLIFLILISIILITLGLT